ncbi:hypothetical protein Fmac_032750 [Flemingia macrophylla]|uniref:FHA domain-containing protein n=1 Tax=Flemingia macrophylla TaxID=520843 RepID=A0ABD1L5U2_9FABA
MSISSSPLRAREYSSSPAQTHEYSLLALLAHVVSAREFMNWPLYHCISIKGGTQQHRHLSFVFVFVFVSGQPCSGDLRPPVQKRLRSPSASLRHHTLQEPHGRDWLAIDNYLQQYVCYYGPPKRIGRAIESNPVDIDLGKGGQGNAISRRQAIIKMDKDGSFYIKNLGKSSILINSKEVHTGQSQKLHSNYLVEAQFTIVSVAVQLPLPTKPDVEMADGGHNMALLKPVGGIGCGELDKSPCAIILIHEDCSNFG